MYIKRYTESVLVYLCKHLLHIESEFNSSVLFPARPIPMPPPPCRNKSSRRNGSNRKGAPDASWQSRSSKGVTSWGDCSVWQDGIT